MTYRMDGKSAIVTGAAKGIGLAIARRLVRAGAFVVMADQDEDRLIEACVALGEEGHDGKAQAVPGDVSQKLTMANLLAATMDATDRLDVLVNAARLIIASPPDGTEDDHFDEIFAQNVTAALRMSQLAARRMTSDARGPVEGAIVNVSSVYALRAPPRMLAYSVACAGLEALTRGLAAALGPKGIRVNAIRVGGTPGTAIAGGVPEVGDFGRTLQRVTPLARAGRTTDAAEAALFLASPGAGFVTGHVLTVDGGRLLVDPLTVAAEEG